MHHITSPVSMPKKLHLNTPQDYSQCPSPQIYKLSPLMPWVTLVPCSAQLAYTFCPGMRVKTSTPPGGSRVYFRHLWFKIMDTVATGSRGFPFLITLLYLCTGLLGCTANQSDFPHRLVLPPIQYAADMGWLAPMTVAHCKNWGCWRLPTADCWPGVSGP